VRDYLLSPEHPVGQFKARVFARVGYTRRDWQRLQADPAVSGRARGRDRGLALLYGQPYEVRTIFQGPSGRSLALVTIWIIRNGEDVPRFVTAYPGAGA
jgi:hypothetical protein